MQPRTLVGLGMSLLAAGVLSIWYLGREAGRPAGGDGHGQPAGPATPALVPSLAAEPGGPADVDEFLAAYNTGFRNLWTAAEGARFAAEADLNEVTTQARLAAARALDDYVGGAEVIGQLAALRERPDLSLLQQRQLDAAWRLASHYPASLGETVHALVAAEARAIETFHAGDLALELPGREPRAVTPADLDDLVAGSRDLALRRAAWECGKGLGPRLRDQLIELQALRNDIARGMGYSSYFGMQADDYGLSAGAMLALMDELVAGVMPLYQQLHCWARHELAARYGQAAPVRLPAHWLDNRYGQEWPGLAPAPDRDRLLAGREPSWIVEQAEAFHVSLGFPSLPAGFWAGSDLFALPADSPRRKSPRDSAWHIDLDQDVRALLSVRPDFASFGAAHHQVGRIHYFLACSRPAVPYVLRRGANRAFPEGIGSLMELAAGQPAYLRQLGLPGADAAPDLVGRLLDEALAGPVVFLPFAAGTMTHWEHDLYEEDLPSHLYNTRWWEYAARYQGLEPPAPRGEEWCDPATKSHVVDDPARYYDYAVSEVIKHQLHRYICREILRQDVHEANYQGSRETGLYLDSILGLGATRDWAQVMREATGEELSSAALVEYFAPLQAWLEQQNAGRDVAF